MFLWLMKECHLLSSPMVWSQHTHNFILSTNSVPCVCLCTMCLPLYHVSASVPCVCLCTMCLPLYHVSASVPRVCLCTMCLPLYHVSAPCTMCLPLYHVYALITN